MFKNNMAKTIRYKFSCPDGNTVDFSPFMKNGTCLVAGVGPANSGKSSLRKRLEAHYTQSGVLCRTVGEGVISADAKDMLLNTLDDFSKTIKDHGNKALKYFDIDELDGFISDESVQTFITHAMRAWRPFGAGLGLWGQDPYTFRRILKNFEAGFNTHFFFSDPQAGSLHKDTFGISDDELKAIQCLKPRKEVYIIQREKGVSKTVIIKRRHVC